MTARPIELRPVAVPCAAAIAGHVVTHISFEPRGLTVEYAEFSDFKANGVTRSCALFVPHGDQYDDEIDAVVDSALALLADVLEDLPHLPARELPGEREDDEKGMGE